MKIYKRGQHEALKPSCDNSVGSDCKASNDQCVFQTLQLKPTTKTFTKPALAVARSIPTETLDFQNCCVN